MPAHESSLHAFGLSIAVNGPQPPGAWAPQPVSEPSLHLEVVEPGVIAECWSGHAAIAWEARIDGEPFCAEVGRVGDYRFVHGERAVHHLSPDTALLRCAPADPAEPSWWRLVLDSVLFTVALLRGRPALHAGAVVTPAGAVAISAPTGGGKSTLVAELVRSGLPLLADDIVVLEPESATATLAHPGPPLMTVPAGAAKGLGAEITPVGEESWIAVPVHPDPVPLAALVLLERRRGAASRLEPTSRSLAPLLASLLRFPRVAERERFRFELASNLSAHMPIMRLAADPTLSPAALLALLAAEPGLRIPEYLAS